MKNLSLRRMYAAFGNGKAIPSSVKFGLCLLLSAEVSPLWGQPTPMPDPKFWMPNGPINAIVVTNGAMYLGGDFTYIGPRTGPAVLFDDIGGSLVGAPPDIGGVVKSAVGDGAGGFFIGGTFTNVGVKAITNIAHLNPDLSLDLNWNARMLGQGVNALAFNNGRLYAGGQIQRIGNLNGPGGLVVLNASDASIAGNPQVQGMVNALRLAGTTLYVGGQFFSVGNSNAQNLAAIATDTLLATGWNPAPDQQVLALDAAGNNIYVGGQFTQIGPTGNVKPRNRLAALDATTGIVANWNPNPNGIVRAIMAGGSSVYVGGDFTTIGGQNRRGFGAVNAGNGAGQSLDLQLQSIATANLVRTILLQGSELYVGGNFTNALGAYHPLVVGVDITSSQPLPTPLGSEFNGSFGVAFGPNTIVAGLNDTIFMGGDFQSVGGVARQRAAALSLATGAALPWAPLLSAPVQSLVFGTNRVYIGGSFTNINVTNTVSGLAAVNPTTGSFLPFTFGGAAQFGDVTVSSLLATPSTLYVGGQFATVDGQARRLLAAVNPGTGALIPSFNANLGGGGFQGGVTSMILAGSNLYIAGDFSQIGGQNVSRLAAVSATTGAMVNWTPNPNQTVNTLAATSDTLYVGGNFSQIANVSFKGFAAFSLADNSIQGVDASLPQFAQGVNAIGATPTSLYVSGNFDSIGGEFRQNLGCLAAFNASAYEWNPAPDQSPSAIVLTDELAAIGGPFRFLGYSPTNQVFGFLAVFDRTPKFLSTSLSASKALHVVTTTGDLNEAVIQSSPTLSNPTWTNVATNDSPGFSWTIDLPPGSGDRTFFRALAR